MTHAGQRAGGTLPSAGSGAADGTTADEVLVVIAEMLRNVIGDDEILVDSVTMDTSFNDDLELESIEFVALAEQLQQRYGERVDFVTWISELELDELIAMTVGELVSFVARCLEA
jgi:acyl carrier protein